VSNDVMLGGAIDYDASKRSLFDAQFSIFDRVINARFIRKNGDGFTIRSDWEVSTGRNGELVFGKCFMKPSLKVNYRRVSTGTTIECKLHVTNLHLQSAQDANGKVARESFAQSDNPIQFIIVQIGYFSQFPNFGDAKEALTLDDYYSLRHRSGVKLYEEMRWRVLGIYPTKLPPDGVTTFDCVIGEIDTAFHSKQDENEVIFGEDTTFQKFFFEMITKRFPKPRLPTETIVLDKSKGGKVTYFEETGERKTVTYPGPMTDDSARKYGVKCYLTDIVANKSMTPGEDRKSRVVNPIPQRGNVSAALAEIQNVFPTLRFAPLPSGDFVVFDVKDSANTVNAALFKQGIVSKSDSLPAIYSITYSGLRTITCPFSTLIKPFQKIDFTSKYNTGNLTSYFYSPKKGEESFLVIQYTVSFSTNDDDNTMELMSTDSEKEG
jgi:hypothetical protein